MKPSKSAESLAKLKKYETISNVLIENADDDSTMSDVRKALQRTFSNLSSDTRRKTQLLPAGQKWNWAFDQLIKKRKPVSIFTSNAISSALSKEANSILSEAKCNKEVQSILKGKYFEDFAFDVFSIKHKYPLMIIAYEIMINNRKFHELFGFSPTVFASFLYRIEHEYNRNDPHNMYHGAYHAADVLKTLDWCLNNSVFAQNNFDDVEVFALLISAVVHDVGHNGKNAAFHIQSKSELAITYHDMSPLENWHLSTAFRCLYHADSNFMSSFPKSLKEEIKHIMIKTILHTDMKTHQENVDKMANLLQEMDSEKANKAILEDEQRLFVMCTLLHFCDISNPLKPFKLSLKWGMLIYEEFFNQGDEEKDLGMQVTPLCDREANDIIKGQIGFSMFVVQPLLSLMLFLFPEFIQMQTNIKKNCQIFTEVAAADDAPLNTIDDVRRYFEQKFKK